MIGGLSGSYIIDKYSTLTFFICCLITGILGSLLMLLLQTNYQMDNEARTTLQSLIDQNHTNTNTNNSVYSSKREIISEVFSTLKDKNFARIIPLPLIKGFVIGFYTTYLGEIVRVCLIA